MNLTIGAAEIARVLDTNELGEAKIVRAMGIDEAELEELHTVADIDDDNFVVSGCALIQDRDVKSAKSFSFPFQTAGQKTAIWRAMIEREI